MRVWVCDNCRKEITGGILMTKGWKDACSPECRKKLEERT